jgi:hypothetical protein
MYIIYMAKKQKQTIIKKPVGNGNISITIENNLKNTNPPPPPVKRRRRRTTSDSATTDITNSKIEDMLRSGGGGSATGGGLPQIKDVSYIKPPSNNFTVWRNYMNDSFNTTTPMQTTTQAIPEGQARQMGYLPPVPLALPAPPPPPVLPAPPPQPALTNALPQMFLTYMQQQEERNRDRENTLIQMFRNRNNENMGFNSDGRINELPEELEEDLQNAGVTPAQIERVRQTQQEKNKIKSDRRLGTIHGSKGQGVRPGYEDNEYYMASYTVARTEWEKASRPTTRSDTAAGAAGARPNTPPRRGPVPGRSPGKNDRLSQEEREAGAATISRLERELSNATSLQQAFESFGRGL